MAEKRRYGRVRSYARHSTRRGSTPHDPRRVGRAVAVIAGVAVVLGGALLWGSMLKAKSDAYRASQEAGGWTVEAETVEPVKTEGPKGNAISTKIDEWVDHDYDGAILYLGSGGEEQVPFASDTLDVAGIAHGTSSLSTEVDRLHDNGFTVTGVFRVTSLTEEDAAVAAYRKGLELALVTEFARAGLDDLLLLGVPGGNEATDAAVVAYLRDVKAAVNDVTHKMAVGVCLTPADFYHVEQDQNVYSDHLTPGRMLTACDYLAVDLTESDGELEAMLKDLQYPYARYGLRLLLNGEDEAAEDVATTHGFERFMLYRAVA